jgi:WD40 repeat protein
MDIVYVGKRCFKKRPPDDFRRVQFCPETSTRFCKVARMLLQLRDIVDQTSRFLGGLQMTRYLASCVLLAALNWIPPFDQPAPPTLTIETGVHTALIRYIDVDEEGKFLVSSSRDGTTRIWDLHTTALLHTLRVPQAILGTPDVPVAISRDARTMAFAAIGNVFLYDRASGQLTSVIRIQPLNTTIEHLVFSHDGKFLAISHSTGLTVLRLSDNYSILLSVKESIPTLALTSTQQAV